MADYGMWQGLERATGQAAATGMNLLQFQANREDAAARQAMDQRRMGLMEEAAGREKIAFQNAEKKRMEQEALENAYIPASSVAKNIHQTPKLKAMLTETIKSAGFDVREMPDGEIYLPNKAIKFVGNLMQTQTDFAKKTLEMTTQDFTDQSVALSQQIAELQANGKADEKTLAPLMQKRQALQAQIAGLITADVEFQKKLALQKDPATQLPTEASLAERAAKGDAAAQRALDLIASNKRAGSTKVNVNTSPEGVLAAGTKKATEKYAESVGEGVSKRFAQGEEAVKQNLQLDQVSLAMSQGAKTGMGEEQILNLKSFLQTMGVDTGNLGPQELIRRTSNELALRMRNPESGLGLTGNTSNKDLQFLKESVAGLGRTEQGNREIIKAMRQYNRLRQDVAIKQSEIIEQNGGVVPLDIERQLMKYVNEYELFTPSERKAIEGYIGSGTKAQPSVKLPAGFKAGW